MPFHLPSHPSLTPSSLRLFHSTPLHHAKSSMKRLASDHASIPPYPYGSSPIYKQSNFGLYGLQKVRFGNKVSEKNEIKSRRMWRPNVQSKRLWSVALNRYVRTRVTTRVMRTIDKVGGLDEYLLGGKARRIKELGMGGWRLRWRLMQTEVVKERFNKERVALGLPVRVEGESMVGVDGKVVGREVLEMQVREIDGLLEEEKEVDLGEEEEEGKKEPAFMREEKGQRGKLIL